jgi:hypothetical protein
VSKGEAIRPAPIHVNGSRPSILITICPLTAPDLADTAPVPDLADTAPALDNTGSHPADSALDNNHHHPYSLAYD